MNRPNRSQQNDRGWWLRPGQESARCTEETIGTGHRCRRLARFEGRCRLHAERAGLIKVEGSCAKVVQRSREEWRRLEKIHD